MHDRKIKNGTNEMASDGHNFNHFDPCLSHPKTTILKYAYLRVAETEDVNIYSTTFGT